MRLHVRVRVRAIVRYIWLTRLTRKPFGFCFPLARLFGVFGEATLLYF